MQVQTSSPPRILVAEQSADVQAFLVDLLREEGYAPTAASSLEQALQQVDRQTFALVLSDHFTPAAQRRSFREVLRLLRRSRPTPVGLLTSWPVTSEDARHRGFAFLVTKPFDLDLLLAEIASCLHQPLGAEQLAQAEMVRQFFERLNARAWGHLLALCTADLSLSRPGGFRSASGSWLRGQASYLALAAEGLPRFPGFRFEDIHIYAHPQHLSARGTACWIAPDGSERQESGAAIFRFADQRIAQIIINPGAEEFQ